MAVKKTSPGRKKAKRGKDAMKGSRKPRGRHVVKDTATKIEPETVGFSAVTEAEPERHTAVEWRMIDIEKAFRGRGAEPPAGLYKQLTRDEFVRNEEAKQKWLAERKRDDWKTISVYLDDGRVFEYKVPTEDKVREHTAAILTGGYRHCDGQTFEHYPVWRILKVKAHGVSTEYPDTVRGT